MSVGLFFPKSSLFTKTPYLTFNIYSLPIAITYNHLDENIYQQYIIKSSLQGTQRTQYVCTIFIFIMDNFLGVYQQQLNRVQLYKNTNSIMQYLAYTLITN
jgi:hypothetical protein